jgi:phosphoenolpyruvate phosphomutase
MSGRRGGSDGLLELLHEPRLSRVVGARDALTALLAQEAGFDATWVSSLEVSAGRGFPDLGLLTMTECLDAADEVARAAPLPTLVDCDTGYGGPLNVARTVRAFEDRRIAGICLEDKVFPKRNSFLPGDQVLAEPEEFARDIEVACRCRTTDEFTVVARTEALIAGRPLEEALSRAHLYADAGADAILIHSKSTSPREVCAFLGLWRQRLPVVVVPTTYNQWHVDEAAAAGVSMVIYANHMVRACVSAMRSVLARIVQDGRSVDAERDIASVTEIFEITRLAEWETGR